MFKSARIITEVCSPWVTNLVFFSVLGWGTHQLIPGIIAGVVTGPGVMAGIGVMMRLGIIGDHHVTKGHERGYAFAWIGVCLAAVLAVFALAGVDRVLWGAFCTSTVFIGIYAALMKLGLKSSIHVGLWVACCIYLAFALSPWWIVALVIAPVIAWSRVALHEHSAREVSVGAVIGTLLGVAASAVTF